MRLLRDLSSKTAPLEESVEEASHPPARRPCRTTEEMLLGRVASVYHRALVSREVRAMVGRRKFLPDSFSVAAALLFPKNSPFPSHTLVLQNTVKQ